MTKQQSITSLPRSPGDDRRDRMVKYSITMGIRFVCVVLCFFVQGWWLLVCALGAVFLPYIAVVLANVSWSTPTEVARPGGIIRVGQGTDGSAANERADHDGADHDRTADDGTADDGTADDGAAEERAGGDGSADDGADEGAP